MDKAFPLIFVAYQTESGEQEEQSFDTTFLIGRNAQCAIRFTDHIVSSMHARVSYAHGSWHIHDLNSRTGLLVSGEPVSELPIRTSATVQLGKGGPAIRFSTEGGHTSKGTGNNAWIDADGTRYRGNQFVCSLPEGWEDKTVHILSGPLADELQHNITIMTDTTTVYNDLSVYSDVQVKALETELHGCRVLNRESVRLENGMPAHRVYYSWTPSEARSVYQEQLFVLHEGIAYRLASTFTAKSRKLLGSQIQQIMLNFEPGQ